MVERVMRCVRRVELQEHERSRTEVWLGGMAVEMKSSYTSCVVRMLNKLWCDGRKRSSRVVLEPASPTGARCSCRKQKDGRTEQY